MQVVPKAHANTYILVAKKKKKSFAMYLKNIYMKNLEIVGIGNHLFLLVVIRG